jgi:hypothetical protein
MTFMENSPFSAHPCKIEVIFVGTGLKPASMRIRRSDFEST